MIPLGYTMSGELISRSLQAAESAVAANKIPQIARVSGEFFKTHTAADIDAFISEAEGSSVVDLVRLAHINVDINTTLARRAFTPQSAVTALEAAADTIFKVYHNPRVIEKINSATGDSVPTPHPLGVEINRDLVHTYLAASPLYDHKGRPALPFYGRRVLEQTAKYLPVGHPSRPLLAIESELVLETPETELGAKGAENILVNFGKIKADGERYPEQLGVAAGLLTVYGNALSNQDMWSEGVITLKSIGEQHWQDRSAIERFNLGAQRRQRRMFGSVLPITKDVTKRRDTAMRMIAFRP